MFRTSANVWITHGPWRRLGLRRVTIWLMVMLTVCDWEWVVVAEAVFAAMTGNTLVTSCDPVVNHLEGVGGRLCGVAPTAGCERHVSGPSASWPRPP